MFYIILMIVVLCLEVIFQYTFIYFANWLGQSVIKDIRTNMFELMLSFRMKYYDKSAVGRLTTRAVNDIETISSIFSQGLFMIISDLLKNARDHGLHVVSKLAPIANCICNTSNSGVRHSGVSAGDENSF